MQYSTKPITDTFKMIAEQHSQNILTSKKMSNKEQNIIRELVKALDLEELTDGYRRRLQILDSQIEALRQEREALAEERRKLRAEREQLHALYVINLRVLNIVNAPASETGETYESDTLNRYKVN